MQVTMMPDFWQEYKPHPVEDGGHGCLDCGDPIGYRAKRCKMHANQHSADLRTRRREARRKVPGQIARLLALHRARQQAEETIAAMERQGHREVERAKGEVRR